MENGVVNIANYIDRSKFEISILCLANKGALSKRLNPEIKIFKLEKKCGFDIGLVEDILDVFKEYKPDVVHTHNLGPLIYVTLACLLCKGIRLIHGEHASLTDFDLIIKKKLQRLLSYKPINCLHTVGLSMTKQLKMLGLSRNYINTFTNGVDVQRCNVASSKNYECLGKTQYDEESIYVGIVGRFGKYKGHLTLLEAFNRIFDELPKVRLLIVGGGGEMEQEVHDAVRQHQYHDKIIMTGFQNNPIPYYHLIDLLVVVSRNEGLSNTILESMACGTPVLSTLSCGAEELIEDGVSGFILSEDNSWKISECVINILQKNDQELRVVKQVARQRVIDNYSLESMVGRYASAYNYYGV